MSSSSIAAPAGESPPAAPPPPRPAAPPRPAFPPLEGGERMLGTLALSLSVFMTVLDTSIANVSIPAISGDVGVSPAQGTWIITSFAVANAISVPLTGWLTQRFGQVRLFTMSVLMFVLASWLCGLAPNIESLIAFRVLQGLVAGPMIPLSQTLLLASYPPAKAGMAMALWAMTTMVAPVMGPLLGGWITDNVSWPWIFYINIPLGIDSGYFSNIKKGRATLQADKVEEFCRHVGNTIFVEWLAYRVGCALVLIRTEAERQRDEAVARAEEAERKLAFATELLRGRATA